MRIWSRFDCGPHVSKMSPCDGRVHGGGALTSGQGTGLAVAMLPKRTAARTAFIVILNSILAGEEFLEWFGRKKSMSKR